MARDPPAYRTDERNAKAAKVAKGAAVAAQRIATLAVTRGGQLGGLSGLCVHRRGCDRSLTRPCGEQSVAFSEQDAEDRRKNPVCSGLNLRVLSVLRGNNSKTAGFHPETLAPRAAG